MMTNTHQPLCQSLTIVLILFFREVLAFNDQASWSILTSGRDFRLEALVRTNPANGLTISLEADVAEQYSPRQRRAKIDIRNTEGPEESMGANVNPTSYFYSETKEKRLFLRLPGSPFQNRPCASVDGVNFLVNLFGRSVGNNNQFGTDSWFEDRQDAPSYLIGLARILAVIQANRDKMIQIEFEKKSTVRNQPAIKYRLRDELGTRSGDTDKSNLTIYYGRSLEHNEQSDLPLRVWFESTGGTEIIVDFFEIRPLRQENLDQADQSIDPFAYPTLSGCAPVLPPMDLTDSTDFPRVMSFIATIKPLSDDSNIGKYFIAYDARAKAARIDTMMSMIDDLDRANYLINIRDLKRKRCYNMRQRLFYGSSENFLQLESGSQCAMTDIKLDTNDGPYDITFPFEKLTEVGLAKVRGIDAIMYEHNDTSLPNLLFPQLNYRKNNSLVLKIDPKKTNRVIIYTMYYFFSRISDQPSTNEARYKLGDRYLGPLLRIKIYKQWKPIYKIDVSDFIWSLADAPNGDSRDELFSLRERCFNADDSNITPDRYAFLDLDLSYRLSDQKNGDPNQLLDLNALSNNGNRGPITRPRDMIRALIGVSDISSTQVFDVETRYSTKPVDNFLQVRVRAKMVDPQQVPFEAVSLGMANILRDRHSSNARNPDECFWDAVNQYITKQLQIIFSFCYQTCLIDNEAELQIYPNNAKYIVKKSQIFVMDPLLVHSSPCEVLMIERSNSTTTPSRKLWSSTYENLRGKILELPVTESQDKSPKRVNLYIKRIELNNNKWTTEEGKTAASTSTSFYQAMNGLGLTEANSKLIKPRVPITELDKRDLDTSPVMNYQLCHATCMMDLRCNSYSTCSIDGSQSEVECLTSRLNFKDAKLIEEIDRIADPVRMKGRRATIRVKFPLNRTKIEDDDAEGEASFYETELRVDRRCVLYNKNALDMFKDSPGLALEPIKFKNKIVSSVDSEEQCAQLCLMKNRGFFKVAAKAKLNLLLARDSMTGLEYQNKVLNSRNETMKLWCAGFLYVNKDDVRDDANLALMIKDLDKKGAICALLAQPKSPIDKADTKEGVAAGESTSNLPATPIQSERYTFIYKNLYERQYRFRMRSNWPRLGSPGDVFSSESANYQELASFMADHNKQKLMRVDSAEDCARICFMQTVGSDFWCNSFGVFQMNISVRPYKSVKPGSSLCFFNSMTLATAQRSPESINLVKEIQPEVNFVHYEPLQAYTLDDIIMAKLMGHERSSNDQSDFHISWFGVLILIAGSLVCGLLAGISGGQQLIQRLNRGDLSQPFINSWVGGSSEMRHQRFESDLNFPEFSTMDDDKKVVN